MASHSFLMEEVVLHASWTSCEYGACSASIKLAESRGGA